MNDIAAGLVRWRLDLCQVRERLYRAPTPRERERWCTRTRHRGTPRGNIAGRPDGLRRSHQPFG